MKSNSNITPFAFILVLITISHANKKSTETDKYYHKDAVSSLFLHYILRKKAMRKRKNLRNQCHLLWQNKTQTREQKPTTNTPHIKAKSPTVPSESSPALSVIDCSIRKALEGMAEPRYLGSDSLCRKVSSSTVTYKKYFQILVRGLDSKALDDFSS